MPDSKKHSAWFVTGAVSILTAWVALIVGTVTLLPFGAQRTSPSAHMVVLGVDGAGLSGPLAQHLAKRQQSAPTLTHLRLSQSTRRGLFAGRSTANDRVVLLRGGRAVADTRANENGEWQIATAISQITGEHEFAVEQRIASGAYVAGESIRLHVPSDFRQTIDISDSDPQASFQLVAVRAESEDIGSASSRKFDELFRDGDLKGDRRGQSRRVAERNDNLLGPAWSWLRDANRSYHDEVVPRIKRGGGYGSDADADRARDNVRRNQVTPTRPSGERMASNARDADSNWTGNQESWMPSGIASWLATARRGYATEIVPRLSGRVPAVIVSRTRDDASQTEETEAERQRRLERERNLERSATETAEQERLDAARRRREAELRRQAAEEEARRLAEERRQSEIDEARKIAEERRRVLQRRADALARQDEAEAQQRKDREAELARNQDAAEQEALERQRLAALARDKTESAELEHKRRAERELQASERAREVAEERRLEQERRDRLIAEAAAIKRRQVEARERADALRKEQSVRVTELRRRQLERQEELARQQRERARRQRLARAEKSAEQEVERRRNDDRTTEPPRRVQTAQTRKQNLNRFKQRDTAIEFTTSRGASGRTDNTRERSDRVKSPVTSARRVASRRPAAKRKRLTRAQRRRAVRGYRRRSARKARGRCHRTAGRRVDPPGTYTVRRGDSLWRISKRHYRLGRYFRMIQRANKRKIRRARLIYPCQRFYLPRRRRT